MNQTKKTYPLVLDIKILNLLKQEAQQEQTSLAAIMRTLIVKHIEKKEKQRRINAIDTLLKTTDEYYTPKDWTKFKDQMSKDFAKHK